MKGYECQCGGIKAHGVKVCNWSRGVKRVCMKVWLSEEEKREGLPVKGQEEE